MSSALKCNRCKKCFDPFEIPEPFYFTTITAFALKNGIEYQNRVAGYGETDVHLCPTCSKTFMEFYQNDNLISASALEELQDDYDILNGQYERLLTDHISELKKQMMQEVQDANAEDCKDIVYRTVYRLLYASEPDDKSGGSAGFGKGHNAAAKRTKRTEKKREP